MAGNFTNYLENKIINHIFGSTTYAKPTLYLALYTESPTDSTSGTEVTGGSYIRKTITFSDSTDGTTSNISNIDFTSMPECTIVAAAVVDALSGGNILAYGTLTNHKHVASGDLFRIPTGEFYLSLN